MVVENGSKLDVKLTGFDFATTGHDCIPEKYSFNLMSPEYLKHCLELLRRTIAVNSFDGEHLSVSFLVFSSNNQILHKRKRKMGETEYTTAT